MIGKGQGGGGGERDKEKKRGERGKKVIVYVTASGVAYQNRGKIDNFKQKNEGQYSKTT